MLHYVHYYIKLYNALNTEKSAKHEPRYSEGSLYNFFNSIGWRWQKDVIS